MAAAPDRLELTPVLKQRCLDILQAGFHSEEFWPSMHAAEGLTLAGQAEEVRKSLQERLPKETDVLKRVGLARELTRAGDRAQAKILLETLGMSDSKGHVHAAESLYKVNVIGDGKLLTNAMTQDKNSALQMMAAGALAKTGDKDALALIRKRLAGTDADARMSAAWFLAFLGNKSDLPQLQKNLHDDKDPMGRCFTILALACLHDPEGREQLGRNLDAEDATIRALTAEFVAHSRSLALADKLTKMLDDKVLDVRIRSAEALLLLAQPPQK